MTRGMMSDEELLFEELCARVGTDMAQLQVPGVGLGVGAGGAEHSRGLGITSVEHPLPVTSDTIFAIGSVTKVCVASAALRLVERGLLALDRPVRDYLPDFTLADAASAGAVTVRQLLTHTGGWLGDYGFNADYGICDDALSRYVADLAQAPQLAPAGALFSYNNAGFMVLARVFEAVSGRRYEEVVGAEVFAPLGMAGSAFTCDDIITRRIAAGHRLEDGQLQLVRSWERGRATAACGGIKSTVADLLRFGRAHQRGPDVAGVPALLAQETLAQMHRPALVAEAGRQMMGLAWFVEDWDGTEIISHRGAMLSNHISLLLVAPLQGFVLVVLTNAGHGNALIDRVLEHAGPLYLGRRRPKRAMPDGLDLPGEALAQYVGRYELPLADVEVALDEQGLTMAYTHKGGLPSFSPQRLVLSAPDTAYLAGPVPGAPVEFLRAADGTIGWLRYGLRVRPRAEPAT